MRTLVLARLKALGCRSQGETREEALSSIREAIGLWLEVEAEEAGIKQVERLELAI